MAIINFFFLFDRQATGLHNSARMWELTCSTHRCCATLGKGLGWDFQTA